MKKFEYITKESDALLLPTQLNDLGNQGWELVSHTVITHEEDNTLYYEHYYVFKREFGTISSIH